MMHVKIVVMENMTDGTVPYFVSQDAGLADSEIQNKTENLFQISSVKKNNSVISSSVLFTFGFLSNILALIVLKRSPSDQKRKLFYRLVAGLTMTDLIGTTATSPVVIAVYVNDFRWIGGTPLCKYFGFMMIFSGVATTTIVCIMAIERLICIRHPYLYYAQLRKKHATVFLFSAWLFSGLIASLPLIGFGEIVLQYPYTWCFFDYYTDNLAHRGFNCLFAILVLLTISVTVTCNGIVLYTLFQTKMRGISRQNSRDSRTFSGYSRRYTECQMAVLLIGITVVFSSCYLPLMIRILINQTKLLPVNLRTDLLMIRFASLNQVLDPWVYILLRREVVWKVANTLKKLFSKQSKDSETSKFMRQDSSAVLANDVQYSCCAFCWHCLCDPPQTQRAGSFYSDYRKNSIYSAPSSPTNNLVMNVMKNVVIPDSSKENSSQIDRRSQVILELKRQASMDTDVVCQEPTTKDTRVKFYCNGSSSFEELETQICNKLVEDEEFDDYSEVDSV
ncbi:prostaglandin E2 receptor EP4 subtype-like [Mercenaria mercenaria]|uniref:prostaglandin E2 receptor EP4 subtype-like n=1 Tax=Mercenaria mercenaria TaxID=6596 RepID=UPI00234F8330|nr:prostaglandin E2 receptor EP4 subtype-like [Mercenaria mercenaria]XP_045159569.2 prostaglandin E2 receptor EP4 subtype-like [Mercenaria mercenaria]XP_053394260.1 prostaglandin E2 receptor EP4 subtype-like [Mercenaria mercenaria]